MEKNEAASWQDDQALIRFTMIAPLLETGIDDAKRRMLRQQIADKYGLSVRTIYRYEGNYRQRGFSGLKPQSKNRKQYSTLPENFSSLLEEAIALKREVPTRSVNQIIAILEMENRVEPGKLKRSTLERHLYAAGYGVRQMQMYKDARSSSSKRFCKPHRMMLLQGDIKYGPLLPIGKNGAMKRTYLSSVIDDHSRFILASRFYDSQEGTIVEDTFHTAISRYGIFDKCYLDNGTQYIAKQLKISLSRLGISISHAPVRSGKSKGKIEKFHQIVDQFLAEVKLKSPKSLEELNQYWNTFLNEYYQKKPHEGIREYYESLGTKVPAEGISPMQEWNRDSRALTFVDTSVVAEAFRHHEYRVVNKGACISFRGREYETKAELIGFKVEISYDPAAPETITVSYPGIKSFEAEPLKIGSYCDKTPALPVSMTLKKTETSRMLDALAKKQEESRKRQADALSFADYGKEGLNHV